MGSRARGQGLTPDPVAGLRRMAITSRAEVRGPVAAALRCSTTSGPKSPDGKEIEMGAVTITVDSTESFRRRIKAAFAGEKQQEPISFESFVLSWTRFRPAATPHGPSAATSAQRPHYEDAHATGLHSLRICPGHSFPPRFTATKHAPTSLQMQLNEQLRLHVGSVPAGKPFM